MKKCIHCWCAIRENVNNKLNLRKCCLPGGDDRSKQEARMIIFLPATLAFLARADDDAIHWCHQRYRYRVHTLLVRNKLQLYTPYASKWCHVSYQFIQCCLTTTSLFCFPPRRQLPFRFLCYPLEVAISLVAPYFRAILEQHRSWTK